MRLCILLGSNELLIGFMILLHLNMSLVQGGDEMKVGDLVAFAVQSYMTGPWSDQKSRAHPFACNH